MELKWLKTFIIAAKYENFRKTSEELYLSQPAITKHIKKLEDYLDIQLFERIGKKITLTSAGYHFLPHAREIVSKYEQGLRDFDLWKQGYKRKLVIATSPQIAASVLPGILRRFMEIHPDIEVLLNILNSYEIGVEVDEGRANLGLTKIQPIQANLNCEEIHKEPVMLVGPWNLESFKGINEQQLFEKYIVITHNHPEYWDQLVHDLKRNFPHIKTMKVNQIEITKRLIEEGLGVSYLPLTMVKEEIKSQRLIEINSEKIFLPTSSTFVLTKVKTSEVCSFVKYFKREMEKC
ncbi:LysR family transcriptional repressor of citA [Metabacillus crassostreae]|uniref:LysR family transcriptional regulator n=1 Tax=Metabacillus crassostreae TaxID=929098 RepID=UPI00195D0AE2|nr:LysR family transcriptional regulator [Metabacillus crassostreae]MBM7602324.1 LysR family transcriptional repressor of citA [Metabacillus crassostreae]